MRSHVFAIKPNYCLAFRPGIILVRCPKCGHPHEEYFGPRNRDEREAEISFLRGEYQRLAALIALRNQRSRGRRSARTER